MSCNEGIIKKNKRWKVVLINIYLNYLYFVDVLFVFLSLIFDELNVLFTPCEVNRKRFRVYSEISDNLKKDLN